MIFITGDVHGEIDFQKLSSKNFPLGKTLTSKDYVIVCGDMGLLFDESSCSKYVLDWFTSKPWTTLYVDGNHENFDVLNALRVSKWKGGKVHKITPNIIHLMRGQIYDIDGLKIFTMGGATSTDIDRCTPNVDWWTQELPTDEEYEEGLCNLEKVGNKVDLIISHCAPNEILNRMYGGYYIHDKLTGYLEVVRQSVEFSNWYFGHYHINKNLDNFHCIYEYIDAYSVEENKGYSLYIMNETTRQMLINYSYPNFPFTLNEAQSTYGGEALYSILFLINHKCVQEIGKNTYEVTQYGISFAEKLQKSFQKNIVP